MNLNKFIIAKVANSLVNKDQLLQTNEFISS
jgi:hypothetical protein